MNLPRRSQERIKRFYGDVEGLSIPVKVVFDSEFSPSEKLCLTLISQLCWANAAQFENQFWTDYTNNEIDTILGGVSLRSLHRHFQKFRRSGLIRVDIVNEPRPNYRKIHLTTKGIKYFFDIDVSESVTVEKSRHQMYY